MLIFGSLRRTIWNISNKRFIYKISHENVNTVRVAVKQGVIIGQKQLLPNGRQYEKFLGVPYALPPLGKLRFKSPLPLERFDVPELDCRQEGSMCHQKHAFQAKVLGTENCLFLNLYVPKTECSTPLPVMVWIHGGGFMSGSGSSDDYLPERLIEENVIVVTLNYRLGALGFLYLPEEGIHGNAGLKDQRLALQWIQDNISHFNGDANNVTLFGESSGACAVHFHLYADHAGKLFHRAILQSGTGNMEWVLQLDPEYKTRRLAELLGFQDATSETDKMLSFLQSQQVTPDAILSKTLAVRTADERRRCMPFTFKPVVEDEASPDKFIAATMTELLCQTERIPRVPLLVGYNSAEGLTMLPNARTKLDMYDKDLERLVPRNLIEDPEDPAARVVAAQMRDFYFRGNRITTENLNEFADLFSDYHFTIDMQFAIEMYTRYQLSSAPLYFYRFDYVGERNIFKRMFQCENLRGVCHGDEMFYLFQNAGDTTAISHEDALVSKRICQLWTNFARHGNPSTSDCNWTPIKLPTGIQTFQLNYLSIDRHCQMRSNPDSERMDFWRNMYKIYKNDFYAMLTKNK